ncbi:hypothetical protein BG000_011006 [Podila horticola]|nr:hypothetical protein BG000_011006 [Podila horticola]
MRLDEIWTKNTCSKIGKEIKWYYSEAQDYCETGNMGTDFHEIWTKNTCSNLNKEIKWCYGAAQDFCETGDMGNAFRSRCSERGSDCFAVDC